MKFSANLSILFTEVPFLERFKLAAAHGFKAVEFWFPYEWKASDIQAELSANDLVLIGLNTAPGNAAAGDWGLTVQRDRQAEFRDGVHLAFEYASALNCGNVHVMAGFPAAGTSHEQTEQVYQDNIRYAAGHAATLGKNVLIEPLNPIDRPGYWLSRQSHARSVVEALGLPNVKIMFDLYHVQMTEGRIASTLLANLPHIGHIQIADVPGRGEPGTGEINYPYLFDVIEKSGYSGWVGCEYKPVSGSIQGLSWMARHKVG
ncbi:MAG: hydroxypyruvate isomerase [Betaproteobacteria bacterium]|nr:MAG: hydroxypyruvate isomerase [Betaproteobacteria bacterium]